MSIGTFCSLDGADDSARVANGQGVSWNVFGYYTSGTDDAVVSDGDTGQYADVGTYPYIVADMNGFGIFQSWFRCCTSRDDLLYRIRSWEQ